MSLRGETFIEGPLPPCEHVVLQRGRLDILSPVEEGNHVGTNLVLVGFLLNELPFDGLSFENLEEVGYELSASHLYHMDFLFEFVFLDR